MTVNEEINDIARRIKEEVNSEVTLTIGNIEDPSQAVPVLCERMDTICAMMDYQATMISNAEKEMEEAKFQYKRRELRAKQKYNEAFVAFKQEDRPKPKSERRTDKEYEALASLEASIDVNEVLSKEKEYLRSQHNLTSEKHRYETLNNHFLSYRKACDLLMKELNANLGGAHRTYKPNDFNR